MAEASSILHGPTAEIPNGRLETLTLGGCRVEKAATMALDADGTPWTFGAMDAWSEAFGRRLVASGVAPGDFVPVLADHGAATLALVLGILRAGAVYVPLDRRWPAERIRRVIARTNARTVIADLEGAEQVLRALETDDSIEVVAVVGARGFWDDQRAAAIVELWDTVAEQQHDAASAGFALGGPPSEADVADATVYLEHVLGLCSSFLGSDVRVIDVGAGSGLLATRLAKLVRRYTAIDPSPVALDRLLARLGGAETDTTVGFAHELSSDVFADADLVLFSSCVQFFPSLSYLWRVLETVSAGLTSGSHVVLADLVDADSSMPARGHLGVTRAFCRSLSRLGYSVEIRERGDGWPEALSHRFDVLLTFTRQTGAHGREVLDLDAAGEVAALPRALSAHDPAYCIFTSGSTGDPKGVLVSHRAAANIIAWVNGEIGVGPGDRMLSVAPLAFDLSIYDLFGVPAAGATVVFAPQRLLADPDELVDLIEQHSVTLWNSAPAAFAFLLTAATPDGAQRRASVRHVLLSGDFVPLTMPGQLRACFPEAKLTVLGGATEATVWSSFHHTNGIDPAWVSIPYGTPVANSSYYVLDEHKHLAPIGSPGELHIGGDGVALGYVGDPDTTKRKFVPDPWRGAGSRMYATGDLVRVTSDGTSEILGRIDSQVKVNGHRIELTEIESALTRHDAVLTAGAWVDSAGKLCAAITERPGGAVDVSLVRAFIGSILPTYMVPSSLTRVDSLPMSYNGKLDRARLDTWVSAHAAN